MADDAAFYELVDFDRFLARIKLTGVLSNWNVFEIATLRTQFRDGIETDQHWTRLAVVNVVTPLDDPDSRVVYAHGWDEDENQAEIRLWIGRSKSGWKLYDWERLDLGLAESRDWELHLRLSDDQLYDPYEQWQQHTYDARLAIIERNFESAKKLFAWLRLWRCRQTERLTVCC
jgi:hypothetical protein